MNVTILIGLLCAGVAALLGWRHFRGRPAIEAAGDPFAGRRRSGAGLVYAAPDPGPRHFEPRQRATPSESPPAFDIPDPAAPPVPPPAEAAAAGLPINRIPMPAGDEDLVDAVHRALHVTLGTHNREALTWPEIVMLRVYEVDSHIGNGGLASYFDNVREPDIHADALAALEAIGAEEAAAIFAEALARYEPHADDHAPEGLFDELDRRWNEAGLSYEVFHPLLEDWLVENYPWAE